MLYFLITMGLFIKIFVGFWLVWILWYLTGGPLRDDKSKPFIGPDETGRLQLYGTSTLRK
jgi:hypothetical protein